MALGLQIILDRLRSTGGEKTAAGETVRQTYLQFEADALSVHDIQVAALDAPSRELALRCVAASALVFHLDPGMTGFYEDMRKFIAGLSPATP